MDEAMNCDEIPRQLGEVFGERNRREGLRNPGTIRGGRPGVRVTIDSSTPIGRLGVIDIEGP